jgi:hypothetical protein
VPQSANRSGLTELLRVQCRCKDVIGCYHPPQAQYPDAVLQSELRADLEFLINLPSPSKTVVFVVAGDFDFFDTDFWNLMSVYHN